MLSALDCYLSLSFGTAKFFLEPFRVPRTKNGSNYKYAVDYLDYFSLKRHFNKNQMITLKVVLIVEVIQMCNGFALYLKIPYREKSGKIITSI
jgi:hypothetical protein